MPTAADLIKPALRMAGIARIPHGAGAAASADQYFELIPALNRMISSWNVDHLSVLNTRIDEFALTAGQKIYTVGPGGQINMPRPIKITAAANIFPTVPQVRTPIKILETAEEWQSIAVQDISGAPISKLYYDGGIDSSGRGRLYCTPQPPAGYKIELVSGDKLSAAFAASTDAVTLADGYELAIVTNFAIQVAMMYPDQQNLSDDVRAEARRSLYAIRQANATVSPAQNEAGLLSRGGWRAGLAPYGGWLKGPFNV